MEQILIELDEKHNDLLCLLKAKARTDSDKEIINTALSFLDWGLTQLYDRRALASVDEKNKTWREVEMPMFKKIKEIMADET